MVTASSTSIAPYITWASISKIFVSSIIIIKPMNTASPIHTNCFPERLSKLKKSV